MLSLSRPQGLVMVRVLNRGCVPALERLGVGLHCTKYCGRATRRGWGPASLYTEILHLKKKTSFKIIKKTTMNETNKQTKGPHNMRQVGQAGKQAGEASDPRHRHILSESRSPAWASSRPLAGHGVVSGPGGGYDGEGYRPGLNVGGWHGHAVCRQLLRQRERQTDQAKEH